MTANQADGTRSECYESENTLGLNDEVFYFLEGITAFLIGDTRVDADKGTFLRIPVKTIHDYKNKTGNRTGALNFSSPVGLRGIRRRSRGGLRGVVRCGEV